MFESSIVRMVSVIVVMLVVGFGWYKITASRLKRRGVEESQAITQAKSQARTASVVAAFLYMVAMVSIAGLFL